MINYKIAEGFHILLDSDEKFFDNERTSNCCGEPVYSDSDICSGCNEHCGVCITCPTCEGEGEYDVVDQSRVNCRTETPPYRKVVCEDCRGEGWIEE